jgi:DNA-binding NarL/FixJ family response regulator
MQTRRPIAILYGEAHGFAVEGFRTVIGRRHRIVGTARDGLELVDAALRLKPDLVVLGISLPLLNGIEAARLIKTRLPQTKVLILTRHDSQSYVQAAMGAGVDGYVLKSDEAECMLEAIEEVMAGNVFISSKLCRECLSPLRQGSEVVGKLRLTTRERQVLQQVAEGHSAKEIAGALRVSIRTVSFHRENIKRKLGVRTTADLTRSAMEMGLVPPPG